MVAGVVAIKIGGVVLTATALTAATYVGTLITMSRMPKAVNPEWNPVVRVVAKPLIAVNNWLMRSPLALTVMLGAMVGWVAGITTVTGVVTIAVSALLGDILVAAWFDGCEVLDEMTKTFDTTLA